MVENDNALIFHHGYSRADIDDMFPWERSAHILLINKYIKEQERKDKDLKNKDLKNNQPHIPHIPPPRPPNVQMPKFNMPRTPKLGR